jgi:hypothetical protein
VDPDAKWKTAQAFSIIAVVIGGLAMCFNCCVICTTHPSKGYQCFSFLYLFTCLSQGLTFLFMQSTACLNNPLADLEGNQIPEDIRVGATCNRSWGANTSIAATCLWFLCATMMCCIGFKESKEYSSNDNVDDMEDDNAAEAVKAVPEEEQVAEE